MSMYVYRPIHPLPLVKMNGQTVLHCAHRVAIIHLNALSKLACFSSPGRALMLVWCGRRTSTFLSCAFREHRTNVGALPIPPSSLVLASGWELIDLPLRTSNESWFIWSISSIWLVGPEIHPEEPDRPERPANQTDEPGRVARAQKIISFHPLLCSRGTGPMWASVLSLRARRAPGRSFPASRHFPKCRCRGILRQLFLKR
jgi:hypothetical protein